jgi:hypothetical protein
MLATRAAPALPEPRVAEINTSQMRQSEQSR